MTLTDAGSALQIIGGGIEVGALVWAARKADTTLRQHRWEDAQGRLDTEVEIIVRSAAQDIEGARGEITRFLGERIDGLYGALEDVARSPVRLFIGGVVVNVVGVVLAAGWF